MAQDDAAFAIDIARAAMDEAEDAALEADVRREKANELAALQLSGGVRRVGVNLAESRRMAFRGGAGPWGCRQAHA